MNLHPACIECKRTNVAKKDIVDSATKKVLRKKGEFAINCSGIPLDPESDLVQITPKKILDIMGEEEIRRMARLKDPHLWAVDNLVVMNPETLKREPWSAQEATDENIERYKLDPISKWYQEVMTRCTSNRQVFRIGRRSGKSWTIVARILHKMFTENDYSVLVIAPNLAQINIIFDLAEEFIMTSPTLKGSSFRSVKSPPRELELPNGSLMRGFVAGSNMVRGQSAKMIVIDEADYVTASDFSAVMAILSEYADSVLLAASTPSGAHSKFYQWNHDPQFRAFHFPSMCRPKWNEDMEYEQRKENPGAKYDREVLAKFTEIAEGVFQHENIDESLERLVSYRYEETSKKPGWLYTMGIDWNPVNGTEAYVLGMDPEDKIIRPVDKAVVYREGNTQTDSMNEIIRLNRKWGPSKIYADIGAGATQVQILREFGRRSTRGTPDSRFETILEAIDFGSKIEINDPATNQKIKVYAKPAIVEFAVKYMESGLLGLTRHDKELEDQLRGYIIKKINGTRPVFGMITDELSDHALDAFILALFGFTMELTPFGNASVVSSTSYISGFGGGNKGLGPQSRSLANTRKERSSPLGKIFSEDNLVNEHGNVSNASQFVRNWYNDKKEESNKASFSRTPISRRNIRGK